MASLIDPYNIDMVKIQKKLQIATGSSRKTRAWKNTELTWPEMVERLTAENKTQETFEEYKNATKEEQAKIKDVGGYVGAYLKNGSRKKVVTRQLLTLDMDFAHQNLWEDFQLSFDNAAVLHATHSHSEENPRYRLIMPLSRKVTAEEYEAIARQVAGTIGIDLFDGSTFEVHRLMFWPSNPKDIPYYSEVQDGPWLDADTILDSYADWQDLSQWPRAENDTEKIRTEVKRQADPETKGGIIGAFCRSYNIREAIAEFLSEVYEPAGDDSRYTYKKGTTSAGLIIYENNKFAYSHHDTDPISGLLCNSFDLVRVHKFGDGSTKLMEDFCLADDKVKEAMLEDTKSDFEKVDQKSIFIHGPLVDQLNEAALKPPLRAIVPDFIYENDLCILFAGTNAGKTTFGTQILETVASGKRLGGFKSQVRGKALYLDMEMDDRKLAKRYGIDDSLGVYQFSEDIIRMSPDRKIVTRRKAQNVIEEAIDRMLDYNATLLFVDNFSAMGVEHEKSKDAYELMRLFRRVTNETNGTIIIAAHTPKRDASEILQDKDLAGSAVISNSADSIVGIGQDLKNSIGRYLKGFKNRDAEKKYSGPEVLECEIRKAGDGLLFFDVIGPTHEYKMLVTPKEAKRTLRDADIMDLKNEGMSLRDIAVKMDMSLGAVQYAIKKNTSNE